MFLFKSGYCQQYYKIMLASNQKAAPAQIPAVKPWNPYWDCSITLLFSTTGKNLANLIYPQTHTYSYSHRYTGNLFSLRIIKIPTLFRMVKMVFFYNYL